MVDGAYHRDQSDGEHAAVSVAHGDDVEVRCPAGSLSVEGAEEGGADDEDSEGGGVVGVVAACAAHDDAGEEGTDGCGDGDGEDAEAGGGGAEGEGGLEVEGDVVEGEEGGHCGEPRYVSIGTWTGEGAYQLTP